MDNDQTEEVGGMVDINALFEDSAEKIASDDTAAAPEDNTQEAVPSEDNSAKESTTEKQ